MTDVSLSSLVAWGLLRNRALCLIHSFLEPKTPSDPKQERDPAFPHGARTNYSAWKTTPTVLARLRRTRAARPKEHSPSCHSLSAQVPSHPYISRCKAGSCCRGSGFLLRNKVNSPATDLLPPRHRQISCLAFSKISLNSFRGKKWSQCTHTYLCLFSQIAH